MERYTISKSEKQTIFEIYRACRLCGAGGGYRMPIIQNIVDLDTSEVELRQKIQDCLHLEVRPDDRMPPLVCELCVDKVNDFYDFLELSRQTNVRTRTRLGLPLPSARKGESDPGDCILGVTEPLCVETKKTNKAGPKCYKNIKKENDVVEVMVEAEPSASERGWRESSVSCRSSRALRPTTPRPARVLRTQTPKANQVIPDETGDKTKFRISKKEVSDLLLDQVTHEDNSLLVPRTYKRVRELEAPMPLLVPKRAKITPKEPTKEPVKPVIEPIKAKGPTKPLKEPTKPLKEPTKPLKEPTKPLKEPTKPLKEPTKPLKEPTKLAKELARSVKELTKLIQEPTKLAKELKPVAEPTPPKRKPGPKSKQEPKIPEPLKIPRSKPKVAVTPAKEETPPPKQYNCIVCKIHLKSPQGVASHVKSHVPTFTKPQNACNPCGKWFSTAEEATVHHRYHRSATFPYHCRRCFDDYSDLRLYEEHIENNQCAPSAVVPDVKCDRCWKEYPTRPLLEAHRCLGVEGRPGGKCSKCQKWYATIRNLKKHESMCKHRRTRNLIADPDVLRRLKPMQVRISRCDDLLNSDGEYCDVSRVEPNYGLDNLYIYPYMNIKVKSESFHSDSMVTIRGSIKHECEGDSFIHWDSEDSDSDNVIKKVESLSTLSIKKLFSKNMLGKVPRKKRRVKNETFDTIHGFGNITSDINDIISSLGDDSNHFPNDLVGRNMGRNMNEQLRISLNHIIGVPDVTCGVDLENENVVSNENSDVRNERIEKSVLENEDAVSNENSDVKNEKSVLENEDAVSNENSDFKNKKSVLENEDAVSNENSDVRNESIEKSYVKKENEVSIENDEDRNESTKKSDLEMENNYEIDENTEKSDLETENEVSNENNDDRNVTTEKGVLENEYAVSNENSDVKNEKSVLENENAVSNENRKVRNESIEKSDVEKENEVSIENNDEIDGSTKKSDLEIENNDEIDENTEKSDLVTENEVSNENNNDRNVTTEKSYVEMENVVSNENNEEINESTEKSDLEKENEFSDENNEGNESIEKSDLESANENNKNESSDSNDLGAENVYSKGNNDFQNDISEKDCKIGLSDKSDISDGEDNLNNEHLTNNAVAEESGHNDKSNVSLNCENNDILNNTSNDCIKLHMIDTDSQDKLDTNVENTNGETEKVSSDMEINHSETTIDRSNELNNVDSETETLSRLNSEVINNFESSYSTVKEISLQNLVENKSERSFQTVEENVTLNGIYSHENSKDDSSKINYDCKDKKAEELNIVRKGSPIKHSIENLIGDVEKTPDKYINEVISSLEDIIMKNPRNEGESDERLNGEKELNINEIDDQNLMDALDAQIGEDKITLEDLLPQDHPMELDDLSEDNFNFDV